MSQNGKGDCPRPFSVSKEVYETNWERTFGRKEAPEETFKQPDETPDPENQTP